MITARMPGLKADPALPQRDRLLDEQDVADMLAHRLGVAGPLAIERCDIWPVKYRSGESLRVLYRFQSGAMSHAVAARTFPPGRAESIWQRSLAAGTACDPLRPVVYLRELDTVLWTFPNDRKIATLPLAV